MSDKNKPPTSSSAGTVSMFQPNTRINKGDIFTADSGYWVCLITHTTGNGHYLKPGQSDDKYHWVVTS